MSQWSYGSFAENEIDRESILCVSKTSKVMETIDVMSQ